MHLSQTEPTSWQVSPSASDTASSSSSRSSSPALHRLHWWKASVSFLFVLMTMPLGHALMIILEHSLDPTALHYAAFAMGAVGMVMVIAGVFARAPPARRSGVCSAGCSSGPDGWSSSSCTMPTVSALSRCSTR